MKIEMPKEGVELIRTLLDREVKTAIDNGDLKTALPLQDLSTRLKLATVIEIQK